MVPGASWRALRAFCWYGFSLILNPSWVKSSVAGEVFDVLPCGLVTRLWTSALFILTLLPKMGTFTSKSIPAESSQSFSEDLRSFLEIRPAGRRRLATVGVGAR